MSRQTLRRKAFVNTPSSKTSMPNAQDNQAGPMAMKSVLRPMATEIVFPNSMAITSVFLKPLTTKIMLKA